MGLRLQPQQGDNGASEPQPHTDEEQQDQLRHSKERGRRSPQQEGQQIPDGRKAQPKQSVQQAQCGRGRNGGGRR